MFMEINTGNGCGNPTYNAGIANFQIYDNYDLNAGGTYPEANTFGFSAPFATAKQPGQHTRHAIPMSGVVWYNNLLKGVVNNNRSTSASASKSAPQDMKIYNNTVMAQWPTAGYAFGGTAGGSMQDNYACLITPSQAEQRLFRGFQRQDHHHLPA